MFVVMTVRTILKVPFEKAALPCPSDVPAHLVAVIKSKYCYKINIEPEMRVAISSIKQRFDKKCLEQQNFHCLKNSDIFLFEVFTNFLLA